MLPGPGEGTIEVSMFAIAPDRGAHGRPLFKHDSMPMEPVASKINRELAISSASFYTQQVHAQQN